MVNKRESDRASQKMSAQSHCLHNEVSMSNQADSLLNVFNLCPVSVIFIFKNCVLRLLR